MNRYDVAAKVREAHNLFASNFRHAEFAAHLSSVLSLEDGPTAKADFIMECMPRAWVGTSKANVWERRADNAD